MIQLRTLGSVDLRQSGGEAVKSVLAQPKRLALLAYIAVTAPRGFVRRDQVLALFWPERDDEHARAALNRALYYLRHSLGNGVLVSRGNDEIGLSGDDFECDAATFQMAVAEHRFQDAVQLYRGDLLEGFFVSDGPGFESWLESERERLRVLACRAGWGLADASQHAGNGALAIHWARWAVERAPWDEVGLRRLMTLLDASGDRAGAVRTYERFARRLANELEVTPSPESESLANAIRLRARVTRDDDDAIPVTVKATAALSFTPVPAPPQSSPLQPPPLRKQRRVTIVAALALVVSALITAFALVSTRGVAIRSDLIVLVPFQNRTGDPTLDVLARRLTDVVSAGLAEFAQTSANATRAGVVRLELAPEHETDLRGVARRRRAGTTIAGSISQDGDDIRLQASLLHLSPGGSSKSYDTAGVWVIPPLSTRRGDAALRETQQRIVGGVAVLRNPQVATWIPLASPPPLLEAFEEYLDAGRYLEMQQYEDAVDHFARAAALDASFTVALLEAAPIHRILEGPWRADSILQVLKRDRSRMRPLQQHWLDWELVRYKDVVEAYRILGNAAQLAPDKFLRAFAVAAHDANRPRETIELLQRMDRKQPTRKHVPVGWSIMATAYHELGEYRREIDVVMRARRDRPDRVSTLWYEARARAADEPARVLALLDTVLSLPAEPFYNAGNTMVTAAEELYAHGHAQGLEAARRAVAWYRSRPPDEAASDIHRSNLATALYYVGCWSTDVTERHPQLAEADSLLRYLYEQDPAASYYEGQRGVIAACRGDRADAQAILADLSERLVSSGPRDGENLYAQAMIKAALGDADGAIVMLRNWAGGQGSNVHADFAFDSLRNHPQFREFLRPKG